MYPAAPGEESREKVPHSPLTPPAVHLGGIVAPPLLLTLCGQRLKTLSPVAGHVSETVSGASGRRRTVGGRSC